MEYNRNHLLDVIRSLYRWRKPVIWVTAAAALLAVIGSLMLSNYYAATTVFYAATPALQSPSVIFGESDRDLEFYGTGEDMDRLLQAAVSNELVNYMTQKFDLYERYEIDTADSKAKSKLRKNFLKRYEAIKNERDAIELTVEDKDPAIAAAMANVARDKINEIANGMIQGSQMEILKSFERQIDEREKTLAVLSDSLSATRNRYGIFDADYQAEVVGSALPILRANIAQEKARLQVYEKRNKRDSIRSITTRLIGLNERLKALTQGEGGRDMSQGISRVAKLAEEESTLIDELSDERAKYQAYKAAFEVPKPALFIQDHAEVPTEKSWPKRSILVLGITALAFFFSLLGVLLLEYNRDINWKEVFRD